MNGCSLDDDDVLDCTLGADQTSDSGDVQSYAADDITSTPWSAAMVAHITDLAKAELVHFKFRRDVSGDDFAHDIFVIGVELKYKRTHDTTF